MRPGGVRMSHARPHGKQGWADSLSRLVVLRCQPSGVLGERVSGAEAGVGGADGERTSATAAGHVEPGWPRCSRSGEAVWPGALAFAHMQAHKSKSP